MKWWITHINVTDFNTFNMGNWASLLKENSTSWEDVEDVIKHMGIKVVDEDHKVMTEYGIELSKVINKFENSVNKSEYINEILVKMNQLNKFAIQHFRREEEIIIF